MSAGRAHAAAHARTLVILRHAQAEEQKQGQRDFDRHLTAAGERQAVASARRLRAQGFVPQLVLASAAARTQRTAELAIAQLQADTPLQLESDMYSASAGELLAIIRRVPADVTRLLVVGHNPGVSELGKRVGDHGDVTGLTTAGFYRVRLDADWTRAGSVHGAVEEVHEAGIE